MTRYRLAEIWLSTMRWALVVYFMLALTPWKIGPEYIVNFFVVISCVLILTIIARRTITQHFVDQYNAVLNREITFMNHAAAMHQQLERGVRRALEPEDVKAEAAMERLRQSTMDLRVK